MKLFCSTNQEIVKIGVTIQTFFTTGPESPRCHPWRLLGALAAKDGGAPSQNRYKLGTLHMEGTEKCLARGIQRPI